MGRRYAALAAAFAAMGIGLCALINFQFSPGYLWFDDAAFALLWLPLALFLLPKRQIAFALAGSALTIAYLVSVNLIHSPGHPWFLYACYPIAWWPIMMWAGRRAGKLWFAVIGSAVTIAYYTVLNLLLSPGYPWVIYPAFAVLWWPMTLVFARRRQWLGYSAAGALLVTAFFVTVNSVSSPGAIWALYPVFAVLWWPLAVLCARRKSWFGFSIAGALLSAALFVATNVITSPGVIWAVYPVFAVLWWPLSHYFFCYKKYKLLNLNR